MPEKRAILLKALLATSLLWLGILGFFIGIGWDFEAERSCSWGLGSRCKLTMCGMMRTVLPASLETTPCWLLNAVPFMLIPGFVLWRIIQNEARLLLGERRRA